MATHRSIEARNGAWWNVERTPDENLRLTVETSVPRGTVEFELDPTTAQHLSDALRRDTVGGLPALQPAPISERHGPSGGPGRPVADESAVGPRGAPMNRPGSTVGPPSRLRP